MNRFEKIEREQRNSFALRSPLWRGGGLLADTVNKNRYPINFLAI
jgi:hypothetical protein